MNHDPKYDTQAEEALLAAALLEPATLVPQICATLPPTDFYVHKHQKIAQALVALHEARSAIDLVTVEAHMRHKGTLDEIGGRPGLGAIAANAGSAANAPAYIEIVRTCARRRELQIALAEYNRLLSNGADLAELQKKQDQIASLGAQVPPRNEERLQFLDLAGLLENPPAIPWLIRGYVGRGDVVVICSQYGTGKTWLGYDLGISVTTGRPWLGKEVDATGPVVYFDRENGLAMIGQRWAKLIGSPTPPPGLNYLHFPNADITSPEGFAYVQRVIDETAPAMLVFDTLSKFHSAEENSNAEMTRVMSAFNTLAKANGVAVILLHHFGKDDGKKTIHQLIRGASAIMDNCEQGFVIRRITTGLKLEQAKARQYEMMETFAFKISNMEEKIDIAGRMEPRIELLVTEENVSSQKDENVSAVVGAVTKWYQDQGEWPNRGEVDAIMATATPAWTSKRTGRALNQAIVSKRLMKTDRTRDGVRYRSTVS